MGVGEWLHGRGRVRVCGRGRWHGSEGGSAGLGGLVVGGRLGPDAQQDVRHQIDHLQYVCIYINTYMLHIYDEYIHQLCLYIYILCTYE